MGEKTTIEIENLRDLKQHALDTNKTLKQIINEAINEKIMRERQLIQKGELPNKPVMKNEQKRQTNQGKIAELKKLLSNAGLLTVVEKECNRHNIQLKDLSVDNATEELMNDIETAITLVFDDDTAEEIIQEIESLLT
jgi:hypothetical protein